MICMSPYSIPLCTILTKWPAPSGPTCVTQGPASVFAEIASSTSWIRVHAASDPPGMIDGPKRAPGARFGPSIMPGGSDAAWTRIQDVLEAISAKTDAGPCVTHVGPDGAGHFVKMVHNGIEYGDMQIIAEVYDVLHRGLGLSTPGAGAVFDEWNRGPLESFLVELTGQVCRVT